MSAAAVGLTGCGGAVEVTTPAPPVPAAKACASLLDALPGSVAGQDAREVSPDDASAAAWGDPAIVLRCGVPKPEALRRDSRCDVVNDVGWFAQRRTDGWRFTTIGRSTYVELSVPGEYQPAADALVDVAAAVKQHTVWNDPCQ